MNETDKYWFLCTDENGAEIVHASIRDPMVRMWSDGGRWTSRTGGYSTKDELLAANKVQPACSTCGSPYSTCYTNGEDLLKHNRCFDCDFWMNLIASKDVAGHVVIDGAHFEFDPINPIKKVKDSWWLGYGGRPFTILSRKGVVVTTNDLWHQGTVPERFRDQLPNNATFIEALDAAIQEPEEDPMQLK